MNNNLDLWQAQRFVGFGNPDEDARDQWIAEKWREHGINPDDPATNVDQPLPLPRGVSNAAIGVGSEPGLTMIAVAMAIALYLAWLRRLLA